MALAKRPNAKKNNAEFQKARLKTLGEKKAFAEQQIREKQKRLAEIEANHVREFAMQRVRKINDIAELLKNEGAKPETVWQFRNLASEIERLRSERLLWKSNFQNQVEKRKELFQKIQGRLNQVIKLLEEHGISKELARGI